MNMEYGMNSIDKGVLKYWKKSFSMCHFIYHKSHFAMGSNVDYQNDRSVTLPETRHSQTVNSRWF